MTVEGEGSGADAPTMLGQAAEAVQKTAEVVQTTTQHFAAAIDAGRRPGAPLDRLARLTREVPLQSLAISFLLGFIVARRR
jgi:hypothetical protein